MERKKPVKQSWIVRVCKTSTVEIVTELCTEQEARDRPGAFEVESRELECLDLQVLSVEPNE